MKFGRWILALALLLALAVLAYLLRMTQAPVADSAPLGRMAELAQLETALGQQISAVDAEALPPAVEQAAAQLAQARQELAQRLAPAPAEVAAAAEAYAGAAEAQAGRLAAFIARHAAFVEGLRQFETAAAQAQVAAVPLPLQAPVRDLLAEVQGYAREPTPASGPRIIRLLAQIQSGARALAPGEARSALERLRDAALAVLPAKDESRRLADQLKAAAPAPALDALRAAYVDHQRAQAAAAERYRVILVAYTVALLIAFGLIGLRLRYSIGALDRANAELQNTNVRLEQQVQERTRDLRQALTDLRQQQAQLIQSEKMASLGQMVAGVAHEINTPLGYATSNIGVVREALPALPGDAEVLADYGALLTDAEHGLAQIADLVMSLKNFSRVDRSRTEPFNVNDGLETALKICHNQYKNRIEVERDYGELPLVPCAPSQLNQVFLNLLTNAAQAIQGEGRVTVRTRATAQGVEIAIRDSGCGMDRETQSHIFEPFFTTKDVGQGTGLGLTIVFRIIEDHQGRISVESAPGAGTEFTIVLPSLAKAAAAEPLAVAA